MKSFVCVVLLSAAVGGAPKGSRDFLHATPTVYGLDLSHFGLDYGYGEYTHDPTYDIGHENHGYEYRSLGHGDFSQAGYSHDGFSHLDFSHGNLGHHDFSYGDLGHHDFSYGDLGHHDFSYGDLGHHDFSHGDYSRTGRSIERDFSSGLGHQLFSLSFEDEPELGLRKETSRAPARFTYQRAPPVTKLVGYKQVFEVPKMVQVKKVVSVPNLMTVPNMIHVSKMMEEPQYSYLPTVPSVLW